MFTSGYGSAPADLELEVPSPAPVTSAPTQQKSGVEAGHILVIEDSTDVRELLAEALQDEGYRVTAVSDALKALVYLRWGSGRTQLPDLILLDLFLPDMDGWTFRRVLLEDPRLAAVPVLVLSGAEELEEHAERLSVAACLSKPVNFPELRTAIRRVLQADSDRTPKPD